MVLLALLKYPAAVVVGIVTQPDKPRGRNLHLTPSPVKEEALAHQLPVLQPLKARAPEFLAELAAFNPDLIVVAAYGQILPKSVLDLPKFGCLNVHASLLPRHRGASPIQSSILAGDAETGVTMMLMDVGCDTGPMLTKVATPISSEDTAQTLHDRMAQLGGQLLLDTLPGWIEGSLKAEPQPAQGATHAVKLSKGDGDLDWRKSAEELDRRIRAFTPWPGAYSFLPGKDHPVLFKIHRARPLKVESGEPGLIVASKEGIRVNCGTGVLELLEVQREGGRRMTAIQFIAGHPELAGQHLQSKPAT